jgi:hypothetical protein
MYIKESQDPFDPRYLPSTPIKDAFLPGSMNTLDDLNRDFTEPFPSFTRRSSNYILKPSYQGWLFAILITAGNLMIHLYCQNWYLVDPARPHTRPFWIIVAFVLFLIVEEVGRMLTLDVPPSAIVLPSVIGGILACIAGMAGLPGLESRLPGRQGASILGDTELLLLPLITLGQLWMLIRTYRVTY